MRPAQAATSCCPAALPPAHSMHYQQPQCFTIYSAAATHCHMPCHITCCGDQHTIQVTSSRTCPAATSIGFGWAGQLSGPNSHGRRTCKVVQDAKPQHFDTVHSHHAMIIGVVPIQLTCSYAKMDGHDCSVCCTRTLVDADHSGPLNRSTAADGFNHSGHPDQSQQPATSRNSG